MPLHDFRCRSGHVTEQFVAQGVDSIDCPICKADALEYCATHSPGDGYEWLPVWNRADKVFLRFPMTFVQPDIRYESPVDGRSITSKQARIEDLARNNCVAYDPSMKDEQQRRQRAADEKLGRDIENHFDAEVSRMPARKKELLEQELRSGADIEFTRSTATV